MSRDGLCTFADRHPRGAAQAKGASGWVLVAAASTPGGVSRSITVATRSVPSPVGTPGRLPVVRFGAAAVKFRLIKSGNGGLVLSCFVVPARRRVGATGVMLLFRVKGERCC